MRVGPVRHATIMQTPYIRRFVASRHQNSGHNEKESRRSGTPFWANSSGVYGAAASTSAIRAFAWAARSSA
jgi:hypothetical protein